MLTLAMRTLYTEAVAQKLDVRPERKFTKGTHKRGRSPRSHSSAWHTSNWSAGRLIERQFTFSLDLALAGYGRRMTWHEGAPNLQAPSCAVECFQTLRAGE
jgi:hypothetical protein